jgi:hypothetical protein
VSPVQASCPGCGAAIEFKIGSSLVAVCAYCRSVVGRTDRKLEDLGKVAAIVETNSPLEVGLRGKYKDKPFEITGRAQLGHSAGGIWDEWYVAFPNNQWGWLAEAQGRLYLTYPINKVPAGTLPPFGKLQLGDTVPIGRSALRVAEKGRARMVSAEGEIPYRLTPGETYTYADLSGQGATFGTIDYSDEQPQLFIGAEVTLDQLGVPKTAKARREARQIEAKHLSCPQCGGALELRAPDQTQRVTCPSCGSLLDVQQGNLRYLASLEPGKVVPFVPFGSVGTFAEGPMMVIGLMVRSVTFDGIDYFWEEYLLYEPRIGFRWLVRSDDHWSYVKPVAPGDVSGSGRKRYCNGRSFKLFQKADAAVVYVLGEFYWKVSVGETVQTADYIGPPEMLSREIAGLAVPVGGSFEEALSTAVNPISGTDEEINWSLGTYLRPEDVEKAFGISGVPRGGGVAPNQPYQYKQLYRSWAWLSFIAFMLGMFFIVFSPNREVFKKTYPVVKQDGPEKAQVIFTEPIELRSRRNVQITASAGVSNSWLGVEGDFINEETGEVQPFYLPVEYYFGVDGGESWTEGSQQNYTVLSALPAGKYTLRLEIAAEANKPPPPTVTIWIEQGVRRWLHVIMTLLLLAMVPGVMMVYHLSFEMRRWKDSEYSPFRSDDD